MKIAIVSNYYPPNAKGGAEIVASRIADELSARGHEIFVLTRNTYPHFPFNISNSERLPFFLKLFWHVFDLFNPFSNRIIDRVILEEKPDVFLTHNLKGIGVNLSRAIQRRGIFQIHTLHDLQLTVPSGLLIRGEEHSFLNRSFLRRWYERAAMFAIGKPNVIISPSRYLINAYRERGMFRDADVRMMPNPAPSRIPPPSQGGGEGVVVQSADHSSEPFRFLFAGQLESHKGILFLMDAIETINSQAGSGDPTRSRMVELHIAGNGSLRQIIETRCANDPRIIYHGFLSTDALAQQIAESDAVIVPSLCYENSPTIIYDSFAVGVPVIASNIGGIPELIIEGENGFLFEPGNADSFIESLRCFEQALFDRNTIRIAAEKYALETYVDTLEKLFQEKTRP